MTDLVIVGIAIFTVMGVAFASMGARLLRNQRGWGDRWIDRSVPKVFRMGSVETHRKILGVCYSAGGSLFVIIGVAYLASHT